MQVGRVQFDELGVELQPVEQGAVGCCGVGHAQGRVAVDLQRRQERHVVKRHRQAVPVLNVVVATRSTICKHENPSYIQYTIDVVKCNDMSVAVMVCVSMR